MRFIHAADIHFNARNPDPALKSLAKIAETAREREVDLIVIAGDLFDAPIRNSEADSMPALLDACGALLDAAPVVSVQGTPSHDAPGCYEPIMKMSDRWLHIDAGRAGKKHVLSDGRLMEAPEDVYMLGETIITGLPEPSRGWLQGTGQDVADRLRTVLAGIGATTHGRTVPHIHVQHGEVRGATLASGQVLPPGGIAVGTEDLALTGADYVALGHIHKAQYLTKWSSGAVQKPEVIYAGSAYPVDWGERDAKTFIVAETFGPHREIDCQEVPYGHPPRVKIVQVVADSDHASQFIDTMPHNIYGGADTWIALRVPAEWSGRDDDNLRTRAAARGARIGAVSVRVTIERAARERVRVPEIGGLVSWTGQVSAWRQAAGLPDNMGEAHADIIKRLESEAQKEGAIPQPRRWRIKSLRLRGAIGIWRGSGKDEIEIDFDDYEAGVIAVTGPNGAGKTTILENMTPWPTMLTRGGPLQQHFRLRDSFRDLVIVDDATQGSVEPEQYRCLIQIDAQTGKREQRVYTWGDDALNGGRAIGGRWCPLGADGSTAEYERICDELWGPRPLHMLSVVSPQKPVSIRVKGDDGETITCTTDLAQAPRGQKRAVLRLLVGLGAYQAASRKALGDAGLLAAEADGERMKAALHDRDADREEEAKRTASDAAYEHGKREADACAAQATLTKRRAELESVAKAAAASREARARAHALNEVIMVHQNDHRKVEGAIEAAQDHERELRNPLRQRPQHVINKAENDDRRMADLRRAASEEDNAWLERKSEAEAEVRNHQVDIGGLKGRIHGLASTVKGLEIDIEGFASRPDHCPTCEQILPQERRDSIADSLAMLRNERAEHMDTIEAHNGRIDAIEQEIKRKRGSIPERPTDPKELVELEYGAEARRRAIAQAREDLRRAQEWATKRQGLEDERKRLKERIHAAEQDLLKVEATINMATEAEERAQQICVERAVQALADAASAVKTSEAEARHAREDLERCQTAARERTKLLDAAQAHEKQADAYRLVSTALGPDGVQSLLLEHAAPRIAEIANDLLEQSYGSRWRVRIELQREGGAGAKKRMIEDVRFIVRDSESSESVGDDLDPGEQLLETLSGGEGVWIRAAISAAIGRVRAERSGVEWRTALLDEADAGLDEGAAASYWRLVEAAHTMSGRHHTVAITHSGAQHGFTQRIEMGGDA